MRSMIAKFLQAYRFPLGLFVVLRVWTMVWASFAAQSIPPAPGAAGFYYGMEPLKDFIFAPWQRWDTLWYTKIAVMGYTTDLSSHFPPLYPLLIRGFMLMTGANAVAAGLILASVGALASFVMLYHLAREMFTARAARRAVLFLGVFPTAFFLFAAYTEAVFLAFALGAFLLARRQAWVWAGILGACAAMTRPQGMLFVLPLAVEFWCQYRKGEIAWSRAWTLLPVLFGGVAHISWLAIQFGNLNAWFQSEAVMHRISPPWQVVAAGWGSVARASSGMEALLSLLDPLGIFILLAALVWSARRLPLSMTVYLAIIVAPSLFVITTYSDAYPLTSVSRFVVLAFPLFLLLGTLNARWWEQFVVAVSFLLQTLLLVLFSAWVFVR